MIFFDLDGTLIDPKDSITKSVQHALKQFGIDAKLEELVPFIGPPLKDSLQKYYGFTDDQVQQGINYYRDHFSKYGIQETALYDGVENLLKKLKAKNKKLSVVTTKMVNYAPTLVKRHGLDIYFENITASKPDQSNADKPTLVKEALALYPDLPMESFVMIGDREHDIFGAQSNGIDSIGVLYGYGSEEEIKRSKPTHIATTIENLEKLLLTDQV